MDDKSTPITSLNNKPDNTDVVNQILDKYNNLQDGQTNNNMEDQFENRNLNKEIYDLNSTNEGYKEHYQKELQRTSKQHNEQNVHNGHNGHNELNESNEPNEPNEEEYEEYEVIQLPLWKKILNEIRIPIFIFFCCVLFLNCSFDKLLLSKIPLLGNTYNECNTYGFLLKVFLASVVSYLLIKFIKLT